MADTCSITFNRVGSDGKVKVSQLWKDLRKEFKDDRQQAIVHYLLAQNPEFLENNVGKLKLGSDGEITSPSLRQAMNDNLNTQEDLAAVRLNRSIQDERFSYREALENALRFNRSQFYKNGGEEALDEYESGLMATIRREENGKYSIVIVKRNNIEEDKLAEHLQNVFLTDALVQLLQNAGLNVEFLEDSQAKVWFSPEHGEIEGTLKNIATVLQGGETSAEVAEVVGHFIVGAMRDTRLVQRLIKMFSATEEDVKKGDANLTGEQMQEVVFKSGTPESNPLYREDFNISLEAAVEAAGIIVGQQLIAPIVNPYNSSEGKRNSKGERTKAQRFKNAVRNPKQLFHSIIKLAERICDFAMKKLSHVNKYTAQEMIQQARDTADDVVYRYMTNEDRDRQANRKSFDKNAKQTYIHRSAISHLSQRSQDCAKAYYTTVDRLKSIANEVRKLLPRSRENAKNKEIFKVLRQLVNDVRKGVDDAIAIESFSQGASRTAIVKALGGMAEVLSGPVAELLREINSESEIEDKAKTMKDYASMRTIIDVYKQAAMMLQYLMAHEKELRVDDPITIAGYSGDITLREAMDTLTKVLGDDKDGGLPANIIAQMRRMVANQMTEYYGDAYVNMGAARLWPWEADAETKQGTKGRMLLKTAREKEMTAREFMDSFVQSLETDITWFDRLLSAADSSDPIVALGYKATRQANMRADRQAERWWYKLEDLRAQMKSLFGTEDCRIFYEETDDFDEFGNRLTGNLLSADGVMFGVWEKERHAYSMKLKREFRNELERRKQEFFADKDNKHSMYYLSDVEQAALYDDFLAGKPITQKAKEELGTNEPVNKWEAWHKEHSVQDKQGKWHPDPNRYSNKKERGDKYYDLFENPEIDAKTRAARLQWYKRLLTLKEEMDSYLPYGATVNVRAPQITGRLVHRYRNLRNKGNGIRSSLRKAICREMGDGVHIREDEAYMFGTNNEFNEIGLDPLQNTVMFEKDKRERLAFWGVNRLKDMSNLNTDLFSTLLNYGCMAATYNAMSSVVDIAELAKEVEARRTIGTAGKEKTGAGSRAYNRYLKFLEKNVYGLSVTPPKMMGAKIALKMLRSLNHLGTWLALSGSLPGGTINAGTGFIEVVKEALAGEQYNRKDLGKAMGLYFKYLWSNIMQKGGHQRKTDQISLYIRHFNILSENKEFYKGQRYDKGLLRVSPDASSFMGGFLMLPYRSGEHFMQCFPYFAMGYNQKYWVEVEENGVKNIKQVSLMDLYEVTEGEDIVGKYSMGDDTFDLETGKKYPDRVRLTAIDKDDQGNYTHPAFHSAESYDDYMTIQKLLGRIKSLQESGRRFRDSTQINIDGITKEERDVLNKFNLIESGSLLSNDDNTAFMYQASYKKLLELRTALRKQMDECVFTEKDESAFMDLCRNMTNRLHGIYNMEDQTMIQQHWYMALLSGMRGYIFGMITHRFMPNRFNMIQKQRVEGYTDTALKTLWGVFQDIGNFKNWKGSVLGCAMSGIVPGALVAGTNMMGTLGSFFLPMSTTCWLCAANVLLGSMALKTNSIFGMNVQKAMKNANYSEQQYRNIRRSAATYIFISGLTLLKALLSPKFTTWDDDDDEPLTITKYPGMGMLYYLISRWLMEQEAFNNVHGVRNEAKSIDWFPIGLKTFFDFAQIGSLGIKEAFDKMDGEPNRNNSQLYYKRGRKGLYRKGDSKFWVKLQRRTFIGDIVRNIDRLFGKQPKHVGRNSYAIEKGYDAFSAIDHNRTDDR